MRTEKLTSGFQEATSLNWGAEFRSELGRVPRKMHSEVQHKFDALVALTNGRLDQRQLLAEFMETVLDIGLHEDWRKAIRSAFSVIANVLEESARRSGDIHREFLDSQKDVHNHIHLQRNTTRARVNSANHIAPGVRFPKNLR
jgi:hypothetical protein